MDILATPVRTNRLPPMPDNHSQISLFAEEQKETTKQPIKPDVNTKEKLRGAIK